MTKRRKTSEREIRADKMQKEKKLNRDRADQWISTHPLSFLVRLTSVELGAQLLSPYESSLHSSSSLNYTEKTHQSSSTNHFLVQPLTTSDHGQIRLREHQYLRVTCVVARALPAVTLTFPFDIDYRIEKNLTSQNDDQTYRTILVLILHIHRSHHRRQFHCEATQNQLNSNDGLESVSPSVTEQAYSVQHRVLSNTLQMDVLCKCPCVCMCVFIYVGIKYSLTSNWMKENEWTCLTNWWNRCRLLLRTPSRKENRWKDGMQTSTWR